MILKGQHISYHRLKFVKKCAIRLAKQKHNIPFKKTKVILKFWRHVYLEKIKRCLSWNKVRST